MRLEEDVVRETLADAWERWARRCAELTPQQWSATTRCSPWDVQGLVAHLCPNRAMFDMLTAAATNEPAAVTDASEMLRLSTPTAASPTRPPTPSPKGRPPMRQRSRPTEL